MCCAAGAVYTELIHLDVVSKLKTCERTAPRVVRVLRVDRIPALVLVPSTVTRTGTSAGRLPTLSTALPRPLEMQKGHTSYQR